MGIHSGNKGEQRHDAPQGSVASFSASLASAVNEVGEADAPSMAKRVDDFDWASTPLGPRADWPSELEIIVRQILDSGFPQAAVWGPEFTTIYNDAFRPILGDKPEALGRSFADVWSEAWDQIGPIAERAYAGSPTYIEDFPS